MIKDIRFRSTRVRTFDNEVIAVPNSELTANAVTNTVLNGRLRLTVPVRVGYDDDLDAVVRILSEAAADNPDVLEHPEPVVRVTDLDETVEVVASMWIAEPDRATYGRIQSEYAREILGRLEGAGVDLGRTGPQEIAGEIGVVSKPATAVDETAADR